MRDVCCFKYKLLSAASCLLSICHSVSTWWCSFHCKLKVIIKKKIYQIKIIKQRFYEPWPSSFPNKSAYNNLYIYVVSTRKARVIDINKKHTCRDARKILLIIFVTVFFFFFIGGKEDFLLKTKFINFLSSLEIYTTFFISWACTIIIIIFYWY